MWGDSEYATNVIPETRVNLMEIFNGSWVYKPYGSKSTNREIYMTYHDFASVDSALMESSAENVSTARLAACYVWQTQSLLDKYMGMGQHLSLPRLALVNTDVRLMNVSIPVYDGDDLVKWPDEKQFWVTGNYAPFKDREVMLDSHMDDLYQVLDDKPCIILMNTGIDFAEKYKQHVAGVILVPGARMVYMAAERRIQAGASEPEQPAVAQDNLDAQDAYERFATEHHKDILEDFFDIARPGLYLAAAGTGKSSFVKWAAGQTKRNIT
jgi:hypothetical protein